MGGGLARRRGGRGLALRRRLAQICDGPGTAAPQVMWLAIGVMAAKSDNLILVKRVSATELARNLSDLLDAVEHRGECLLIVRQGREVARIEPASAANGAAVKALLRQSRRDAGWAGELRELRASLGAQERAWDA